MHIYIYCEIIAIPYMSFLLSLHKTKLRKGQPAWLACQRAAGADWSQYPTPW